MTSPFATGEDHSMLWYEQALHASTHVGAIAFGILIAIYYLATYYGLKQRRVSWGWMAFNTALVVLGTVNLATSIHYNESAWIDERNYPGGPFAFLVEQQNRPGQTVGNSASIVSSTMAEGLLLYRVFVIWKNRWYISVLPTLFFLACTALSIVTVIQFALPNSPTWTRIPSFAFSVWIMLMVLNIVLTLLLASRLLYMRHKLRVAMGTQYGKTYTGIAAMLVESALPFGIFSVIFLVLFGKNDPAQNLFIPLLVQVECISPMLIILRVIRGRAWTADTIPAAPVSAVKFATGMPSSTEETGTRSMTGTNDISELTFKHHSESELPQEGNRPTTDTDVV